MGGAVLLTPDDIDANLAINIAKDLAGLKAQKGKFSEMALADIEVLATAVRNILELAEKAVTTLEYADARKIEPLEEVVDALTEELRSRHIQRMTRGDCDVYSGIQYDNILSNMERIADQCSDLGLAVIALTKSSIFGQEHQGRLGEFLGKVRGELKAILADDVVTEDEVEHLKQVINEMPR